MELRQGFNWYYDQWAFLGGCGCIGGWVHCMGNVQLLGCPFCTQPEQSSADPHKEMPNHDNRCMTVLSDFLKPMEICLRVRPSRLRQRVSSSAVLK